jgi:hypothetical protein
MFRAADRTTPGFLEDTAYGNELTQETASCTTAISPDFLVRVASRRDHQRQRTGDGASVIEIDAALDAPSGVWRPISSAS